MLSLSEEACRVTAEVNNTQTKSPGQKIHSSPRNIIRMREYGGYNHRDILSGKTPIGNTPMKQSDIMECICIHNGYYDKEICQIFFVEKGLTPTHPNNNTKREPILLLPAYEEKELVPHLTEYNINELNAINNGYYDKAILEMTYLQKNEPLPNLVPIGDSLYPPILMVPNKPIAFMENY